jgi:hypothetical protein
MEKRGVSLTGLLVSLILFIGAGSFTRRLHAAPGVGSRLATIQSQMFTYLHNLEHEFAVDHTVHWKHGEVTISMSVAPTNFDGCSVTWSQTQEATRPMQLFYIETHRFEVPLSSIDAKQITVEPAGSGPGVRPGIEPGDYYTVLLPTSAAKKSVNMVYHDIVFDPKKGPVASVEQLMVSSAWVRVRQEEQGELLKKQFQQAIAACIEAGQ